MVEFVHEARQPLTVAQNYLTVALRRVHARDSAGGPPDRSVMDLLKEELGYVQDELDRLGDQIERIRSHLRDGLVTTEPASAVQSVRDACVRVLRSELAAGIDFQIDLPEEDVPLRISSCRVSLVVENLLRNACEAIQAEHSSTDQSRDGDTTIGTVSTRVLRRGSRVCVEVTDDGPGIPQEWMEEVFEPYFSTKAGGLGLGLSLCRTIVEREGGCLRLDGSPGRGTRFTAEFLVAEEHGKEQP